MLFNCICFVLLDYNNTGNLAVAAIFWMWCGWNNLFEILGLGMHSWIWLQMQILYMWRCLHHNGSPIFVISSGDCCKLVLGILILKLRKRTWFTLAQIMISLSICVNPVLFKTSYNLPHRRNSEVDFNCYGYIFH